MCQLILKYIILKQFKNGILNIYIYIEKKRKKYA